MNHSIHRFDRRRFNSLLAQISAGAYVASQSSSLFSDEITNDPFRPNITSGIASGDVTHSAATIWSRSDRAARMIVELSSNESFKNVRRIVGPDAFEHSDFTAKLRLNGLKPGEPVFYRVRFQDLSDLSKMSAPLAGRFNTPALCLGISNSLGRAILLDKATASTFVAVV